MIPLVLYDLLIIFQSLINPNTVPNIFGIKTFDIISSSMSPTIDVHDVAFIKNCKVEELQVGDIITFRKEDSLITHRIIEIKNQNGNIEFVTKGDKNQATDIERVSSAQIEGKYVGRIPKIGGFLSFMRNKAIFFIVITILLLCYLWEERKLTKKVARKEKRELYDRRRQYLMETLQNSL